MVSQKSLISIPFSKASQRSLAFAKFSAGCALALLSLAPLKADPFRLVAIGDSLTEEYRFEIPFSAPDSDPGNANVKNWVELLHERRPGSFSMGGYEPSFGNYADFRNAGYEFNYGVPGFKAERWEELLYREYSFSDLFNAENALSFSTRVELEGDVDVVDAVLIFLGGNDLQLGDSNEEHERIRDFIGRIHDWVRNEAPAGLPIIIATVPDIGATPAEEISDPAEAAASRERVALLNAKVAALGSRPNTYIARIDNLTDRIYDQVPLHINGTEFIYPPDPENPPLHIFCKDGFHPGMAAQALIADEILLAINQFAPTPIPLLSNREILDDILDLNPDQPLIDYLADAADDGDSLPGLIEYVLGTDPAKPDSGFEFLPEGGAIFTPSPLALRYADLTVQQSSTLTDDWIPVPQGNIETLPDGSRKILPTAPKLFYRFMATPRP